MYSSLKRIGGYLFLSIFLSFAQVTVALEAPNTDESQSSSSSEAEPANAAKQPFDVRIIVDISGSMKQTDPNNLRIPALNLLGELMPEGAQAGIWTFGRYVNNILPVSNVDDAWRQKAKASASKVTSLGLRTNLAGALNDAAWGLKADSGFDQSIILLTDGKVDMAGDADPQRDATNKAEREKLMSDVLGKYREEGVHIHTLALSDAADKDLLQQIALETDGLYSQALTADELMKAFLRAFDRAVPAEQVPMEDNTFSIDESVNEFTALVFRAPGSNKPSKLLTPSGDSYSEAVHPKNVRWYKDLAFDLITVKEPEPGTWIAEADLDPSNRVTILSDLALQVNGLPPTIFPGDKLDIEAMLVNEGDVVVKKELLRLTDVVMKVVTATGREGSKVLSDPENPPEDGIYREALHRLKDLGEYQVDVVAEGRTFQRKRSFSMTMIQPVEVAHGPNSELGQYDIKVIPLSTNLNIERSRVIAKIKSPDDNTIIQSMEFDESAEAWVLAVRDDKGPGTYQVDLNVRGVTGSGKNFKVKPESILMELPVAELNPAADEAGESVELGDGQINEDMPAEEVSLAPDLANKMANQEQAEEVADSDPAEKVEEPKEPAAKPNEAKPEEVKEESGEETNKSEAEAKSEEMADDAEEGLAWWVYALLAVANLAIIGGAVWWFVFRKKTTELAPAETSMESDISSELSELDDFEDELAGDFDSLDEGDEEEIPLAADGGASSSMPSGADDESDSDGFGSLDEDFSIDPDGDAEEGGEADSEDSWGEFDSLDDEEEKKDE